MKEVIKESFKKLVTDRYLFWLLSILILMAVIFSVIIAFNIHPSDIQLVSHYSAYGENHWYRDQWYYLLVFVAFQLVAAALHTAISVKILILKGRQLAVMVAWLGIGISVFGLITGLVVINSWIP